MLGGFKKLITRRNKLNVQDEERIPHSSTGTSIPAINEDDSVKNEVVLESEQKYKKFDEDAVLGIGIFEGLKIIYANPAFALIFGYSIEELLSFAPEQIRSLIHPQDQKLVLNNLRNRLAGLDIPQHYQFRAIGKDGNTKTLELYAKKIEFDGKPAVQAICIDLTEKIKTRKALEYSEEKFKKIFENSGIGMSILDPKGKFIKVNKSFADMFNYNFAEFIGLSLLDVTHPSEIEHSIQLMKSLQENNEEKNKQLEKKYIKKNGESFWGFVTITPIKDSAGNLSYYIAQLHDITKRKKTELKLARYAEELKELNTSKDKFFSIISHDLRSPFNALLGISEYTSQFYDELSETEIKDSVINMHNSAKKVYELIQNLLEWTQVQTGRLEVEKSKIDLCEISNEILELYRDTAVNKKVKLNSEISRTINLYADRYMIETVIRNLISNAIKFTYPGGIVSINATVNGVFAEITVLDTGVGIAKENQNKLFKIDAQYRRDGTANEKGTGLGLILCKEFVEKNNGTIRIESKENEWSKFTFTVPLYNNSVE